MSDSLEAIQSTVSFKWKSSWRIKIRLSVLKDANLEVFEAIGTIQMIESYEEASMKQEFTNIRSHFGI